MPLYENELSVTRDSSLNGLNTVISQVKVVSPYDYVTFPFTTVAPVKTVTANSLPSHRNSHL